jgi:hypothetical protein
LPISSTAGSRLWTTEDLSAYLGIPVPTLPARDEALARVERWSREVLDAIGEPADRRLVQAYLTWRILRRLRRRSETSPARAPSPTTPGTGSSPWSPSWPGSAGMTSPWSPAARATWRPGWPPARQIRRSMPRVQPVRKNAYLQVRVHRISSLYA